MPTFPTPRPVSLVVELYCGDVRLAASDRTDSVVEVRPADPSDASHVKAAEQVRVEQSGGRITVKSHKSWLQYTPFARAGLVEVVVEVPTGSSVVAQTAMGAVHTEGELGSCRVTTGMGTVRLDHVGTLHARTGYGDVTVDRAAGDIDVVSGSGEIRILHVDGAAVIRNSGGDNRIGEVAGDIRVKTACGDVTVDVAHGSVTAKTAAGDIRIGEVVRGVVDLRTTVGQLSVGVREGTAAWLDLSSQTGRVRNGLESAEGPASTDETVEVRARTSHGDVVIHRSQHTPAPST